VNLRLQGLSVHGLHEEQPARTGADLPNIVFLLADDLGYGDVQYNGGNASTPNLDAMASGPNSIQLSRYYSGGPVCSPHQRDFPHWAKSQSVLHMAR